MNILIALLILGLLIAFHEFGHFIIAKSRGIAVREFSIGMGPKLFGFEKGGTQYCLRLLPIGGACVMGEDELVGPDDVNAFIAEMCPNLIPSVTLYGWDDYHYDGGYVQVQTHDYNGYNFKENKVLATFEFEVLRHGDGEINLRNLSIAGVYPEHKPLYEYGEEKNGAEVEIFSYLTVLETAVK